MNIALIGMSGIGKSYWSYKLIKCGFYRYCCDDMIEKKLQHILFDKNNKRISMGKWMGLPYDQDYKNKEKIYLNLEKEELTNILDQLEYNNENAKPTVVDTTGSVIYAGEEICSRLRRLTTTVYLAVSPEAIETMCRKYRKNPAPLIWLDNYKKQSGETEEDALVRCYRDVVISRHSFYSRLAHISINYDIHSNCNLSAEGFLKYITDHYSKNDPNLS